MYTKVVHFRYIRLPNYYSVNLLRISNDAKITHRISNEVNTPRAKTDGQKVEGASIEAEYKSFH